MEDEKKQFCFIRHKSIASPLERDWLEASGVIINGAIQIYLYSLIIDEIKYSKIIKYGLFQTSRARIN